MKSKNYQFVLSEPCYMKLSLLAKRYNTTMKDTFISALTLLRGSEFETFSQSVSLMHFDNLYNLIIGYKKKVSLSVNLTDDIGNLVKELQDRYRVELSSQIVSISVYLLWSRQPENKTLVDDALKKMEIIRNWVREGL